MSEPDSHLLGRRQLLRAGAWAAPVLVLAAGVPAAAASGEVGAADITLTAYCDATTGAETNHGFTITNTSTQTATVAALFTAQASGATVDNAIDNLVSATSDDDGQYPVIPEGGMGGLTYQTMWETADEISTEPTGEGIDTAHREGTAIFVLSPGASVKFGQINANLFGEPLITARVTHINEGGVSGDLAAFGFEIGGACWEPAVTP